MICFLIISDRTRKRRHEGCTDEGCSVRRLTHAPKAGARSGGQTGTAVVDCRTELVGPGESRLEIGREWWRECMAVEADLQDGALLLVLLPGEQSGTRGVFKDLAHALVGFSRALQILLRSNLLPHVFGLEGEVSNTSSDEAEMACSCVPAPGSRASAKSCAALQSSSGRISNPSCSPPE